MRTQSAGVTTLWAGRLEVEIRERPFALAVRRAGRVVLSDVRCWTASGTADDRFLQMTEGVIARERLGPVRPLGDVEVVERTAGGVRLCGLADTGEQMHVTVALAGGDRVRLEVDSADAPLRAGVRWPRREGERFVGLGARHGLRLDQAGRDVHLGADRRYLGPACPPAVAEVGGVPQGDCAPAPWATSSAGYSVWLDTFGPGALFSFGREVAVSARASAARFHFVCDPTPAARLRHYCRLTGFPALLPEWAYGHWKSRDVYESQDDVVEDLQGYRWHRIPLDAIVIDSPWETQYNTWRFNPHQFPDAQALVDHLRTSGVRTVVWIAPWVNLDSRHGQYPGDPASADLHREPAETYAEAARAGHFVGDGNGGPLVRDWWMGRGSPVDFTSPAAEEWWRAQARGVLEMGVEGIKSDDGDGYYFPPHARFADGRTGADAAWAYGGLYRRSMQRALDEVHPGRGVLFGRSGWSGQQRRGMLWGGDQVSDFWSLRALVAATLSAAASGFSNWSHDVGGYLGERLVDRCPAELLVRWAQFGCFTPLMHAHGRFPQEPWTYHPTTRDLYRAYVLLHERLVPYVRAAAATAARSGLPIVRPLCLFDPGDPRGWRIDDAYGYGPALWVAPVLEEGAEAREVPLPRGRWIAAATGERHRGGGMVAVAAPRSQIPVFVREGAIVVTYRADQVAVGLGDGPERDRRYEATLWGTPRCGRALARLADGTGVRWEDGAWSVDPPLDMEFRER